MPNPLCVSSTLSRLSAGRQKAEGRRRKAEARPAGAWRAVDEAACQGESCGGGWDTRQRRFIAGKASYPAYYVVEARQRPATGDRQLIRVFCFACWCERLLANQAALARWEGRGGNEECGMLNSESEARTRNSEFESAVRDPDGGMQMIDDTQAWEAKLAPESIEALQGEIDRYLAAGEKMVKLTV